MAISSTGVGSGLDVNSIVSSLMALEQRPLTALQTRASTIQTKLSAFGTLQSQISALGDVATRLADAKNWNPLTVNNSRPEAVGVTATNSASVGRLRVEVQQLAQSQSLASTPFANADAVVGTGTLTLELGTTAAGVFTPRSGSTPLAITIAPEQQTLAGVRDAINAAGDDVTASIVTSGGQSRLVLRGPDGAESSIRLTATDDDGNATDTAGLSALAFDPAAASGAGRNMTQTQAAQDALYTLDGLALRSASNEAKDVVAGITLSFKQVTTSAVDIGVVNDTAGLRKNLADFVNAYNNLSKLLTQQTKADATGSSRGALQADPTAVALQNSLRELLRGTVQGLGDTASLSAIGMEFQRDGTLALKDTVVTKALEQPARLAALFTQAGTAEEAASRGFGVRIKAWAAALAGSGGAISARMEGLRGSVTANQKQQDAMQEKLSRTETRLRAQYQRLDTQMNTLNAQLAKMQSSLGLSS